MIICISQIDSSGPLTDTHRLLNVPDGLQPEVLLDHEAVHRLEVDDRPPGPAGLRDAEHARVVARHPPRLLRRHPSEGAFVTKLGHLRLDDNHLFG